MKKKFLPLHPAQRDVYTDQLINIDSPHYNVGGYIKLKGRLYREKLLETIQSLPKLFDVFNLRFHLDVDGPVCYAGPNNDILKIDEVDFSGLQNPSSHALNWMNLQFNTPFILDEDSSLLENYLLKIAPDEYWYYGKFHHLLTDGYGFMVLIDYLGRKYRSLVAGDGALFSYPSYLEEVVNASRYLTSDAYKADEKYWKEKIGEKPAKLLHSKYTKQDKAGNTSSTYTIDFDPAKRKMLDELQLSTKAGLQHLTIAALIIYFGRISPNQEFVFGIPVHRRSSRKLRNTIGMFSGVLPYKGFFKSDDKVLDFIKEIALSQRADYRHQDYPIGDLSRNLNIKAGEGYLQEISINYEPLNFKVDFGEGIASDVVRLVSSRDRNPLQLSWREYGTGQPLQLHVQFGNEFFSPEEIGLFINRLLFIIEQFPGKLHDTLDSFDILPPEEQLMLAGFNDTIVDHPQDKTLVKLFEEQSLKTPDKIALVFEKEELTYRQLNEKSNQLAHYLIGKGAKPEMLVPVCIERSPMMMIAILGILKAGAAYVPIDPEYPSERISFMLEDTAASICVSSKAGSSKLGARENLDIVLLDDDNLNLDGQLTNNLQLTITPEQLAYIIYTSGSTGKPKGVIIEHRTVVNLVHNQSAFFTITREDRILQFSNYCFDASVEQVFLAFLNGATLVLMPEGLHLDTELFETFLLEKQITHLHATPSFLENLKGVDHKFIKRVIAGGDLCKISLADYWKNKVDFYNEYGPTETTVTSIQFQVPPDYTHNLNSLPIGKPLSHIGVYIVDDENAICPIGVNGEICIGGDCLARGYFNRDNLTAEKFVPDPFSTNGNRRMYRTGDVGCQLPDGNIIYQGRMDEQVKIRGYRIELGEIENVLQAYDQVKQAVVLAREDKNGGKRLVGYVVAATTFDKEAIQNYLRAKLPGYMVPALWVQLEMLPLTGNGKVDKKLLADPDASELVSNEYVEPTNATEALLAGMWKDILKVEKVGIHDSFFELGGHSLNAVQLTTRLHQRLDIKTDVSTVFSNPTIYQLSEALSLQTKTAFVGISKLPPQDLYPLSHAQERFWVLSHFKDGSEAYNISSAFTIEGSLDVPAFKQAFEAVIERHEILRTVFVEVNGKAWQKILSVKDAGFSLAETDLVHENDKQAIIKQLLGDESKRPFDLSKGPLLRATLFHEAPEKYTLVFNIHHIISDGWSKGIFVKDFFDFYRAFSTGKDSNLAALPIQYKDYAAWHSASFGLQGQYWKTLYKNDIPVLDFPTDFERPKVLSFFGEMVHVTIPETLCHSLEQMALRHKMSLNNLLLSLYAFIVARYSNQQEVVIGSLTSGRSHVDLENLIGVFINFLPIKFTLNRQQQLKEYFAQCNESLSLAYNNQDYPFDLMVEDCIKQRDVSRNPFFDTMLNFHLQNDLQEKGSLGAKQLAGTGITIKPLQSLQDEIFQSVLDFKLDVEPKENKLKCFLSYNSKLFTRETMAGFLNEFISLLNTVVNEPNKRLEEYGAWKEDTTGSQADAPPVAVKMLEVNICASFVMEPVQEYIEYWSNEVELNIDVSFAPYNQVFQQLLDPGSLLNNSSGINALFIRLDDWLRDQKGLTPPQQIASLNQACSELTEAMGQAGKQNFAPFLISIVPVLNPASFSKDVVSHIEKLNGQLELLVKKQSTFHLLDLNKIAGLYEVSELYDAKSDELGHMPFTQEYYAATGTYLARKVSAFKGPNYKVIALDCDNTLWKGICGELGAREVVIDDNFIQLQEFFIEKYNEGFLIVLCSKNNEADVWEVFNQHPDMKLTREHIAAHRINWEPKSDNLLSISKELNLGLNSFIFLDDSEFEVEQMAARAPEVLGITLPEEAGDFHSFLNHIWAFDYFRITEEDIKRNYMYKVEKQRREEEVTYGSVAGFLDSLNIEVNILPLSTYLERAVQLTLRTNQFNLNGIRKTAEDVAKNMQRSNAINWVIEVKDRFGDYGIVGLLMAQEAQNELVIETFLLSCRVLGRNVEDHILAALHTYGEQQGLNSITALFTATSKNKPFQEFLARTEWVKDQLTNTYSHLIKTTEQITAC